MLDIPISTVEELFDKGIIEGWKHPVTGWRMIDPKSVEALKTLKEKITRVPQKEG